MRVIRCPKTFALGSIILTVVFGGFDVPRCRAATGGGDSINSESIAGESIAGVGITRLLFARARRISSPIGFGTRFPVLLLLLLWLWREGAVLTLELNPRMRTVTTVTSSRLREKHKRHQSVSQSVRDERITWKTNMEQVGQTSDIRCVLAICPRTCL